MKRPLLLVFLSTDPKANIRHLRYSRSHAGLVAKGNGPPRLRDHLNWHLPTRTPMASWRKRATVVLMGELLEFCRTLSLDERHSKTGCGYITWKLRVLIPASCQRVCNYYVCQEVCCSRVRVCAFVWVQLPLPQRWYRLIPATRERKKVCGYSWREMLWCE